MALASIIPEIIPEMDNSSNSPTFQKVDKSKYLCIYVIMSELRDGGCSVITVRVSGMEWREAKNLHNRRLCSLCTLLFGHCVNSSLVCLPCI